MIETIIDLSRLNSVAQILNKKIEYQMGNLGRPCKRLIIFLERYLHAHYFKCTEKLS